MKQLSAILLLILCFSTPAVGEIVLGVHVPPGGYPDGLTYADAIRSFWNASGRAHPLVMFFIPYSHPPEGELGISGLAEQVHSAGAVPIVTLEFYAGDLNDPDYRLSKIADGVYDDTIRATAVALGKLHGEIILRILHEFDTTNYPWGVPRSWNGSAEEFKNAFRHVAEIYRSAGADNVKMMWSPNYMSNVEGFDVWACYPGDDIVDCVGTSGLNGQPERGVLTPGFLFNQLVWEYAFNTKPASASRLAALTKPQFIVEFGTVQYDYDGGGLYYPAEEWIKDAYRYVAGDFPCLSGVCWYNGYAYHPSTGGKDFRVVANPGEGPVAPSVTQAYRDAISDSRYVSEWPGLANLARENAYTSPPPAPHADGTPFMRLVFNHPENIGLHSGNVLAAALYTYPYGEPDAYLVCKIPTGALYSFKDGTWVRGVVPAAMRMPIHRNGRSALVLYKFNGTEPLGSYTMYWGLARAGSGTPIADVIGQIGEWHFRLP